MTTTTRDTENKSRPNSNDTLNAGAAAGKAGGAQNSTANQAGANQSGNTQNSGSQNARNQGGGQADVKQEGNRIIEEGKHAIADMAAQKKNEAAGRVQGFSSALDRAADELAEENEVVAGYMSDAARQLSGVGERIKNTEPADMLRQLEDATRRYPGVVIGCAAAAAFLFARFAQSSSQHAAQTSQQPRSRH
ncbi:hypothetical protein [Allohahella sp. A8]|uniref:hypothetical protein n=1 Tax=Allohahella sp. A8 TaxID=3141461 RepID=UPI000C0BA376|nr:hypothetical protein [Hahellaceae bacterium]|tara:strand:+ start:21704 stop:22279 length:576 start_codon:yes stop_codon:yes gene_type:complete